MSCRAPGTRGSTLVPLLLFGCLIWINVEKLGTGFPSWRRPSEVKPALDGGWGFPNKSPQPAQEFLLGISHWLESPFDLWLWRPEAPSQVYDTAGVVSARSTGWEQTAEPGAGHASHLEICKADHAWDLSIPFCPPLCPTASCSQDVSRSLCRYLRVAQRLC